MESRTEAGIEGSVEMKCKCGAEYEVISHGLGYSIRCKNWIIHQVTKEIK